MGGGVRSRRRRVAHHRSRRRPSVAQLRGAGRPVSDHRHRRALRLARRWWLPSTPATASSHPRGARRDRRPMTVPWAVEARERGAGEILLTSIRHDGQRTGYDLALTAARARRGARAGHRVGREPDARPTSPPRCAWPTRRSSLRSCTRIPAGLAGLRREIEGAGVTLRPLKERHG